VPVQNNYQPEGENTYYPVQMSLLVADDVCHIGPEQNVIRHAGRWLHIELEVDLCGHRTSSPITTKKVPAPDLEDISNYVVADRGHATIGTFLNILEAGVEQTRHSVSRCVAHQNGFHVSLWQIQGSTRAYVGNLTLCFSSQQGLS
jgi:hypothetical protein